MAGTFGDEVLSALPELRAMAESLMIDACTITRGPGEVTTDPSTGEVTTTPTTVYEGRAKVQAWEGYQSNPEIGTAILTAQRYQVHIPVARTAGDYAPRVGDDVTITSAELDPHLDGRKFAVLALLHKTAATAYRLGVSEGL